MSLDESPGIRLLTQEEINSVNGGDAWDVAEGALSGAGAGATVVGIAIGVGAIVTAPVGLGIIGGGALIGAAWEYLVS